MWYFEGSHYLYPELAYLMWGVPVIAGLFWWLWHQRQRDVQLFFGDQLATQLAEGRSLRLVGLKTTLFCLTWMMTTLALMYPYTIKRNLAESGHKGTGKENVQPPTQDVLLLIDASASMGVADARSGESRLAAAKQIADELLTQMHGETVALYAFTSQLIPEVPLTLDYLFLRLMLRQIAINAEETAGTDFGAVFNSLRRKYWGEGRVLDKPLTLILFSDGGDTTWESLQGEAKAQYLQTILDTLKGTQRLQIIAIGMGSPEGGVVPNISQTVQSELQPELLQALAGNSDGTFILGNAQSAFETSRKIAGLLAQSAQYRKVSQPVIVHLEESQQLPDSLYHFPLAIAIVSLITALLIPSQESSRGTS
jgi:Ca-activated chloride channel family protein